MCKLGIASPLFWHLAGISLVFLPVLIAGHTRMDGGTIRDADIALAVHGGAGTILRERMSEEQEVAYRTALEEALRVGYRILQEGGASIDAVIASISFLEDSPLFNAGRGAVLTGKETVELDASIMDGATLDAGAVTGIRHIKNPIVLADLVMRKSPHVMLMGAGAESFGRQFDLEWVENEYFFTDRRREQLRRIREAQPTGTLLSEDNEELGTVGAVALDQEGNLAAGTSTGGMTNKRFGRVGDSPIIGAGTYADNRTCAVSGTGHGEYIMRAVVAHEIAALMRYEELSVDDAAGRVVHETLAGMGGSGGVIAMDARGNVSMPFNTAGMYRGYVDRKGAIHVRLFAE